jgi:hypothetical protein
LIGGKSAVNPSWALTPALAIKEAMLGEEIVSGASMLNWGRMNIVEMVAYEVKNRKKTELCIIFQKNFRWRPGFLPLLVERGYG